VERPRLLKRIYEALDEENYARHTRLEDELESLEDEFTIGIVKCRKYLWT
jgi:uncharacterized protein YpiB (UPF0302 family)